jgi:hypothetical protein
MDWIPHTAMQIRTIHIFIPIMHDFKLNIMKRFTNTSSDAGSEPCKTRNGQSGS